MTTNHTFYLTDSRAMTELEDRAVQLIITSPPYWQLKDYGSTGQIGYNDSYEEYINNLNLVWNECYRVLADGCRMCINIGDQFARSVYYGRYKVIPIRTEIIKFCETIGFDYMGAIIWQKTTTTNTSGGASIMGSFPFPRNGIIKIDYEFILIFKKLGAPPKVSHDIKEKSKLSNKEWNQYFAGHWNFSGVKQDGHLAMFPEELPKRLIKMFSFFGETVLDPFTGSGTTSLAALNTGRHSVGYEINKQFASVISQKLGVEKRDRKNQITIHTNLPSFRLNNQNKMKSTLPYVFKDSVKVVRKVDPKRLNFGSKIDATNRSNSHTYTVKKILSPEKMVLNNDLLIKLIGIKTSEEVRIQAIEYLEKKLKKQRVFFTFDNVKYDKDGTIMCYLYLKNKTFINAHLIKSGFVDYDRNQNYRYYEKFSKLHANKYGK